MKFNIRVYGLLIHDEKILLTQESRYGKYFTKFPGGGLEFGEGIKDCLIREFKEEFELPIQVDKLFYVNDFFQASAFSKEDQIISIYYLVSPKSADFTFDSLTVKNEKPYWIKTDEVSKKYLTFPIDQIVGEMIQKMSKIPNH
jgi:8-oxo-dGTP pyrophosphatase MutT (NUDIX family)